MIGGTKSCETTNVLKLQTTGVGALPAPDDLNNITTRPIPRPYVISRYFARSPRVDSHNQGRQHDQMLEELWLTHYRCFRLLTTVAGIHVTECWKLAKHYLPRHHPLKESTVVNFADVMFKALIYNGLTGEVEPTRRTESVLADITNEPPPLPHSIMHLGKRQGNDNATKQATMCRVDDDNVGWTSYKCPDCDIPHLCIPSKRRKSVACWTRHRRITAQELAVYDVNRRADEAATGQRSLYPNPVPQDLPSPVVDWRLLVAPPQCPDRNRCLSHPERKDFGDRIAEVTVKRPELFYLAAAGVVAAQFNVCIDDCDRKAIKNAVSRRAAAAKQLAILKANVPPSLMRT
eukprot:jgi/Tetstr1/459292/TSEL_004691.t1